MHEVSTILWWIGVCVMTKQVWSIANVIDQDCVVSLTIPRNSIKSSCNTDERTLRKMQALEAKFSRLYTAIRGLEVRMPQIASHQGKNQETMNRLEFNLAQSATYVKKLEDKILQLESRLPQTGGGENIVSQRSNSLDSLMDPVRPLLADELEKFKDKWMKNLAENIVPVILNPENKLGLDFKERLLQNLKIHIKPNIRSPSETIESSSEIEDDDEITNSTKEELKANEFMIVTKPTKIFENTSKSPWDSHALDMLARTLKNVSFDLNATVIETEANEFEKNRNSSNSSSVLNNENVIKFLSFVKNQVSNEMELKLNEIDRKYQNISKILYAETSLKNNISNFLENDQNHKLIIQKNISDIREEYSALEIKVQRAVDDLSKTLEKRANSMTASKMSSFENLFSQKLQNEILQMDGKIYSQSRRVNMTSNLVNIFQESLAKYRNQSQRAISQLQRKVAEISLVLKDYTKDDSDVLKERLRYLEEEIQAVADSQLFMEQGIDRFKSSFTENYRRAQNEIQNLNRQLQAVEYEVGGIDQLKVSLGNQDTVLNITVDKVNKFNSKLNDIQKTFTEFTVEVMSENQWVPYNFSHASIRNDCEGGKKYIRKNFFASLVVKFVGVQLCSNTRYKIFLGPSKGGKFYDIGDRVGRGEDHCQFVGATIPDNSTKAYTVDRKLLFYTTKGKQSLYIMYTSLG